VLATTVYLSVVKRRGEFLGKTVQVVPPANTSAEIKERMRCQSIPVDTILPITEIGGTVGKPSLRISGCSSGGFTGHL
jgi:CTP synthase (UTP-ammonia lyase)